MIEDSTLGFNAIDGSPTDSDGRQIHDNDGTGSAGGCGVSRVAAATLRQGPQRRLFLEALHHHLAAAEALRQMEGRVEAVFGMFFDRLASFIGTSGADVRFHRGSRPCLAHFSQCNLLTSS